VAHFVKNWKAEKLVLNIRHFPGEHSGDNILAAIKDILNQWEIEESKVFVFLTDSARNMKKVVSYIYSNWKLSQYFYII
jgi:hypothetical protein